MEKQTGNQQAGTKAVKQNLSISGVKRDTVAERTYKYADRAKRFRAFFLAHWKEMPEEFCAILGIRQNQLKHYLMGRKDPMELAARLKWINADTQYIETGVHEFSLNDLMCVDLLREHGITTGKQLEKVIKSTKRCTKCTVCDELYSEAAASILKMFPLSAN